jgi:Clp amino terminal domain, pathogenicity island component
MFDRFTEHARRAIFFARYEAGSLGSRYIETEHLLLGLIREDKVLPLKLPGGASEQIRKRIAATLSDPVRRIATSGDLPLSSDSKRVLSNGAEQADELSHKSIDCGHLVLGLLRIETCTAATLLRDFGIDYESYVEVVSGTLLPLPPVERSLEQTESPPPATSSLLGPILMLQHLVDKTLPHLQAYSDSYGDQRLKRKPWTRKEAFGHLVDWAVAHQQWFARALTEPKLVAETYPMDDWVPAQQYRRCALKDLVDLWVLLNRLLIHLLALIPENKLNLVCRIGIHEPIPLSTLIERYVEHCGDVVAQILARL